MSVVVVDTNVVLVANGQHGDVSPACVKTCLLALQAVMRSGKLALDDGFGILLEYQTKTRPKKGNRPGDAFVKWALNNRGNARRVELPRGDKVLSASEAEAFLAHPVVIEEKVDGANLGFSVDAGGVLRSQNRGQYLQRPFSGQFTRLNGWLALREESLIEALGEPPAPCCRAPHAIPDKRKRTGHATLERLGRRCHDDGTQPGGACHAGAAARSRPRRARRGAQRHAGADSTLAPGAACADPR